MAKKTIAEQIQDLQATRGDKAAKMESITEKTMDEGRTKDAAEREEFDTLRDEIKALDAEIEDLRDLEKVNAKKAAPVAGRTVDEGSNARGAVRAEVSLKPKALPKGIEFARYVSCVAAAKGNLMQAQAIAANRYPNDSANLHEVMKAAVNAGSTSDSTWAGPLVQYQILANEFVEYLRPQTILGKFGVGNVPALRHVPFKVKIPAQTSGGSAYWVGEGKPKPLTKFDFQSITLDFTKIANIAVLTDELVRFSNPSSEALVRDNLAEAIIVQTDKDFVDPANAGSAGVKPASITNGVTAVAASGTTQAALLADLKKLFNTFLAANQNPATAALIMTPTLAYAIGNIQTPLGTLAFPNIGMNGGELGGLPVIVSQNVPTVSAGSYIIMVDTRSLLLADDGQVTIDVSYEASLQMDDSPTNASNPITATSVVSLWQTNSLGIRAERYINWVKARSTAVAYISGANYGN